MARRFGRRARRPRVVWLPTFGVSPGVAGQSAASWGGIEATLNLSTTAGPSDIVWDAFPVTFDYSTDASDVDPSPVSGIPAFTLRDIVSGNEYRLRRIVGKAFVHAQSDETDLPAAFNSLVQVGLGFIVAKTYDDGFPTTDFQEVNPLARNSQEDPWIWMRHWMFNPHGNTKDVVPNQGTDYRGAYGFAAYPQSTAGYGSVADGPHIDQKTARIIHRGERLYGVIAARHWSAQATGLAAVRVDMNLHYRLLASLRPTTAGNRRNASR